jgi:succinate dehydrogenase/fumarate reductase cytochrome b subunit
VGIPQIIILSLYILSLGIHLAKHGTKRTGTYSFWGSLVTVIVLFALLYWGGFFG